MTDNIKPLFPGRRTGIEPEPELIALLEDLLSQAKTGELQNIAFVGHCADGTVATGFTSSDDVFGTLGALRALEHKLLGGIEL